MTTTDPLVGSPVEIVEDSPSGESIPDNPQDEFNERVHKLMAMIENDPVVRDRMLCELYVSISEFSTSFRMMTAQMAELGPMGILKAMGGMRGETG